MGNATINGHESYSKTKLEVWLLTQLANDCECFTLYWFRIRKLAEALIVIDFGTFVHSVEQNTNKKKIIQHTRRHLIKSDSNESKRIY